ncbi:MAG: hypothetical protein R6U58_13305 [Bacteroidales bacterium]
MEKYIKTIIVLNTIAIAIFSATMIVKKVYLFNHEWDLRYGGVIFLVCMWAYSIGLIYKNHQKNKINQK